MDYKRTIVIGDVHGCLDTLDEMLRMLRVKAGEDRIVFLGDLVDRGPDSAGVVRRARELNAESVMGNHDEKHVRYRRYELSGKPNPMKTHDEWLKHHRELSDDEIEWMAKMPYTIDLGSGFIAVHAGFEGSRTLEEQKPNKMMRIRYVDEDGAMLPLTSDHKVPPNSYRWTTAWDHPHHVLYGHHVHSLTVPMVDEVMAVDGKRYMRVGLDTGCCFGGTLSAAILTPVVPQYFVDLPFELQFISIPARRAYAQWWLAD